MKHTKLKKAVAVLACCGIMTGVLMTDTALDMTSASFSVSAASNNLKNQIHDLEGDLADIKRETNELKNQISEAYANLSAVEKEIFKLEEETTLIETQIRTINTLITQIEQLDVELESQIKVLEVKEAKEQKIFDNMLRMSYEYGDDTYFNLIFGSESIGDFLSRTDLITYHLEYNNNVMSNLANTKAELTETRKEQQQSKEDIINYKNDLDVLEEQLKEKRAEAEKKKAEYKSQAENAQDLYNKKAAELQKIDAEVKALYAEQKRQEEEQRRLAEQQGNNYQPSPSYTGTFYFPLPRGTYRKTSGFSVRTSPISGKTESHNGFDLAAPYGTPIYAADDGKVVIAKRSPSWGNYVTIDHGGGIMTLYAHASSLNVSAGQTVKKGDVIAYVGSTGWSTGNHLHFTVYKNGVAVDPGNYIS